MNEIYIQYINILVHQSRDTCTHTNVPFLSPSLISIFVSPPSFFIYSCKYSSSSSFIYSSFLSSSFSLSLYLLVSRSGKKGEREGERKKRGRSGRFGTGDSRLKRGSLTGGGGVQACCGRNSVMNTYARVKWWLLICSIRNIWRPMKCRIEQRAAERYDRQELWAPTQSPAVSI